MPPPDAIDLAALRAGDSAAVSAFYKTYARTVLGWCIRLGGPNLDAEDSAHEVFETALKRLESYRGESSPRTWLYGVTRRVLANKRRRAALRRFVGMEDVREPESGDNQEAEVVALRQRRLVQHTLERLRPKHREVLVLSDLEGRSAPEVSELLGIPAGTVYSRLHAARRSFKAACAAEGLVPETDGRHLRLVRRRA